MATSALLLEFLTCFCVSLYLLHKYGDLRRQNVFSSVATLAAWFVSFLLVFTLPIDIASTYYRQCAADASDDSTTASIAPFSSSPTLDPNRTFSPPEANASATPTSAADLASAAALVSPNASSTSSTDCEKPWTYATDETLRGIFRVVYWTSQVLTWIVLPLMQSYAWAGEFTVAGKLKSAIIYNAIYYGSFLLIFGVLLIYVAASKGLTASGLKVICITASNTWGLFLLVLLLGYGLVEVPRVVWNSCNRNLALSQTHFKIAKMSTDKSEAEEEIEDCLEEVKRAAEVITYNHPHRRFVEIILSKCPDTMRDSIRPCTMDDFQDYEDDGSPKARIDVPSEKTLVRLHVRVIRAMQAYNRTQAQWESLVERALELEDEVRNIAATHRTFTKSSATAKGESPSSPGIATRIIDSLVWTPTVEWYWRCLIRPNLLRVVAICFAVLSAMVVWSEVTFCVSYPVLSLFAVLVKSASASNSGAVVFLCGATISYLCLCAYYTIFRIKIFNYYYIASDHLTDENSLLFIGALLCRLTPPLCLNFLGLIHLDSHVTGDHVEDGLEPSYSAIMGHLDLISFIANGFNIYFPILILALCLATHFHLGARCLHFLGFQQFIGDDELTQDYVDDGRNLLNREKRHRERAGATSSRRYRLGAYRPAASSERDALDAGRGGDPRGGGGGGDSFPARSRAPVKVDDPVNAEDPDLENTFGPLDSPLQLSSGSRGGYQSGLPRGIGRTPMRRIFDDV